MTGTRRRERRVTALVAMLVLCLATGGAGLVAAEDGGARRIDRERPIAPIGGLPYVDDGHVWLVSVDGSSRWPVTADGIAWAPRISPDGTRLA